MHTLNQMLLVGGASRNLGKTSLIAAIVRQFADAHIIGLKIKTIRKGDENKHGKGRHNLVGDYLLVEESAKSDEDTGRIFEAGAKQVFHIKAKAHALADAINEFVTKLPANACVVCESNSARQYIKPGLFVMIKNKYKPTDLKPSAKEYEKYCDRIIWTDGSKHDFLLAELSLKNNNWGLRNL